MEEIGVEAVAVIKGIKIVVRFLKNRYSENKYLILQIRFSFSKAAGRMLPTLLKKASIKYFFRKNSEFLQNSYSYRSVWLAAFEGI